MWVELKTWYFYNNILLSTIYLYKNNNMQIPTLPPSRNQKDKIGYAGWWTNNIYEKDLIIKCIILQYNCNTIVGFNASFSS